MMKISFLFFCCALVYISCVDKVSSSISYPEPPPLDSIAIFLPGIVSSRGDSIDFNATFSPDGKTFYFSRSLNRNWDIYETHYEDGRWNKAEKVDFSTNQYSEADPAIGPDGFLYFISNMPRSTRDSLADFDIWFVKPTTNGGWSKPENLIAVNSDSTEYYVSFAGDGNLYFASSRPGGYGLEDIYVSKKVNGKYTTPLNLGPNINSEYSDHDPCLPPNESFIIYTSVDRKDGYGEGDLYMSTKTSMNEDWSPAIHMGPKWNTPTYEYCSYFSPDNKYFFFSSRRDIKWTSVKSLPKELVDRMP